MTVTESEKSEIIFQATEVEKYGASYDGSFSGFVCLVQYYSGLPYEKIYHVLKNT